MAQEPRRTEYLTREGCLIKTTITGAVETVEMTGPKPDKLALEECQGKDWDSGLYPVRKAAKQC